MIAERQSGICVGRRLVPPRAAAILLPVVLTALAGGLIVTAMVRFSPGFGMDEEQMDPRLSPESVQALRRTHDEERNPVRFYATWVGRVVPGDAGMSPSLHRPVAALLAERAPVTLGLMGSGLLSAWLIAIALALPATAWRLPLLDGVSTALSAVAACLPAAGIAVVLFQLGGSATWMIAAVLFPRIYHYLRNLLRQGYGMPHVLLARAKGLGAWPILFRHVVRPGRSQLLSLAAVSVNMAFGAAVAVEAICDLPGLGQLAWKAALARDLPLLVSLTILVTLMTQLSSLAADFCSAAPRGHA